MRSPMEAQSFYSVQRIKSILVGFSKSFDKSLTFAFFSDTLFHNKAALLNESYYITLFVLTTPLQNRGRNLIRGERRTITDTSVHIHTPMPGFENLYPLLNLNFQNLRKKQKASIDPWPQFHKLKLRRTLRSYLLGSAFPKPCSARSA